ncbi:MMPL family transporter [Baekduia soli]|uniref:MMPL family transporter n=1 Tax=Baekduia soli TaxID=496014 RepID=A0A5B8U5B2_9ACTN|nr:MMPL family transporter [Baekduia soli]QEC48273.1 MMPL family transporter [Baekduia soli]
MTDLVVRLRWVVVCGWILAAVAAVRLLPAIEDAHSGALGALVPRDAAAVKAEIASKTRFGFPLLSRTLIVQRDPRGLSAAEQAAVVERAVRLNRHAVPGFERIAAALPVTNAIGSAPFVRERGTTAITYLFFAPDVDVGDRADLARRFVEEHVPATPTGTVGVTGQAAAAGEQSDLVARWLPVIELATIALVAMAVGARFMAVGAPLLTLATVAIAYLISNHIAAWVGQRLGFVVPREVEPIMVVLLFGVVTDYSIFYLSRFRALLADGLPRMSAARATTRQMSPIIFAAGITVIAATATLMAAQLDFLRVFGPGLALSVLVALVVSVTLVPATLAIVGRALFWPRRPQVELSVDEAAEETPTEQVGRARRSRAVRLACERPWTAVAGCVLLLAVASAGLVNLRLANPVVRGLPPGNPVREAYAQAAKGFTPGMLSPTVLVLSGHDVAAQRHGLAQLQRELARQPGVALVLGPALRPPVGGLRLGATVSRDGDAARYFIVMTDDPLGAAAIDALRRIRERVPGLVSAAGLTHVQASMAGDTALSAETIDKTLGDLERIAPMTLLVILLVLSVYLRALVAPLYLIAASVLGFAAAMGIGALIFGQLTYYVPFAVAVLLVSLGSDYNVFLVGRMWQEAQVRPLAEAIPVAASRAAKAITLAGAVLAGSFALIGLVPVSAFREIAVLMTVGLLIDALLLRTILVPALVTIVGARSGWPGGRLSDTAPGAGLVPVAPEKVAGGG